MKICFSSSSSRPARHAGFACVRERCFITMAKPAPGTSPTPHTVLLLAVCCSGFMPLGRIASSVLIPRPCWLILYLQLLYSCKPTFHYPKFIWTMKWLLLPKFGYLVWGIVSWFCVPLLILLFGMTPVSICCEFKPWTCFWQILIGI